MPKKWVSDSVSQSRIELSTDCVWTAKKKSEGGKEEISVVLQTLED